MTAILGRGTVDWTLNDKRFQAGVSRVLTTMSKVQARAAKVGQAVRRMLVVGVAAFTGMILIGVRFEQSMARVRALTDEGREAFERLNVTAKSLGRTTVFTASQAAQAMAELALQGFKTNQIITAMPTVLNLAAAGQLDMATAAKTAVGVMRGMGLQVSDLENTINVLTGGFTSSSTELEELGEAMKEVGPIAKDSGRDLEEVVAVLKALADIQLRGSRGGVILRNTLLRISGGNRTAKKEFDKLNISLVDQNDKLLGIGEVIDLLNVKLASMTRLERTATLERIAGVRSIAAFSALLALSGDQIRRYETDLRNVTDLTKNIALVQLDTLAGRFLLVKSAAEAVAIALTDVFNPSLTESSEKLTENIRQLEKWVEIHGIAIKVNVILAAKFALLLILLPKIIAVLKLMVLMFTRVAAGAKLLTGFLVALIPVTIFAVLSRINQDLERVKANMRAATIAAKDFNAALREASVARGLGDLPGLLTAKQKTLALLETEIRRAMVELIDLDVKQALSAARRAQTKRDLGPGRFERQRAEEIRVIESDQKARRKSLGLLKKEISDIEAEIADIRKEAQLPSGGAQPGGAAGAGARRGLPTGQFFSPQALFKAIQQRVSGIDKEAKALNAAQNTSKNTKKSADNSTQQVSSLKRIDRTLRRGIGAVFT